MKPIREEFSSGERQRQEILGSGVIISSDGLVVTNHHVAEKAIHIHCVLHTKAQVPARVVGLDPETDLALLQLERKPGDPPLPVAAFADIDRLQEGQFVMALGAPFGFERSISLGILSNVRRYIGFKTQYKFNTWLQTDASINPGNSGGPLVDTEGRVVGINTLGGGEIGFAIPSNVVRDIVERLRRDGKVVRAWTGLELQALRDFNSNTFTPSDEGVLVQNVEKPSPADAAGVRSGDILLAVNGRPVDGLYVEQLPAILWRLSDLPLEKSARLRVRRAGKALDIDVRPALKGRFEGEDLELRRFNMTLKEVSKDFNPGLWFHLVRIGRTQGVFIQGVRRPGNAMFADLRRNDILLKMDGREIGGLADAKAVYEAVLADKARREKKSKIEVQRGVRRIWTVLDYAKDYEDVD